MTTGRRVLAGRLLVIGVLLLVLAAYLGFRVWRTNTGPGGATAMAAATVTSVGQVNGAQQTVTVRYDASGRHTLTGQVDKAGFESSGRVVWVCFVPKHPAETSRAYLRLPTDELCGQK